MFTAPSIAKVNSLQEACAKFFAVHILKFEILQTTWKNKKQNKKHQNKDLLLKNWKLRVWCSLFHFSRVICKISKFNMWTGKHLAQASCTELTLNHTEWHVDFQERLYFNIIFSDVQPHESRLLSFRGDLVFNNSKAKSKMPLWDLHCKLEPG